MPFDGSELIATPFRTGAIQPGVWGLLQRAISRMRPSARALPLEFPGAFPTDPPGPVTVQVLRLARTLIEDERHWIQRRYGHWTAGDALSARCEARDGCWR